MRRLPCRNSLHEPTKLVEKHILPLASVAKLELPLSALRDGQRTQGKGGIFYCMLYNPGGWWFPGKDLRYHLVTAFGDIRLKLLAPSGYSLRAASHFIFFSPLSLAI